MYGRNGTRPLRLNDSVLDEAADNREFDSRGEPGRYRTLFTIETADHHPLCILDNKTLLSTT